jgi:hypothetical protein
MVKIADIQFLTSCRAWKPFRSSARKDGAVGYHWARVDDELDGNIRD